MVNKLVSVAQFLSLIGFLFGCSVKPEVRRQPLGDVRVEPHFGSIGDQLERWVRVRIVGSKKKRGRDLDTLTLDIAVENSSPHPLTINAFRALGSDCNSELSEKVFVDHSAVICAATQDGTLRLSMKMLGEWQYSGNGYCPQFQLPVGLSSFVIKGVVAVCDSCKIWGYYSYSNDSAGNSVAGGAIDTFVVAGER